MDVWVEVREVVEAPPILRGCISSIDGQLKSGFKSGHDLTAFIVGDFHDAGFDDAIWEDRE